MTLDVIVRGEPISFTHDQAAAELAEKMEKKPIVVYQDGQTLHLDYQMVERRLCQFIHAFPRDPKLNKRPYWIQPDLTFEKSSFWGRLFRVLLLRFSFLRKKFFGIDLDSTREFLHQLQPQCTATGSGDLEQLFGAAVGIFNEIAPRHEVFYSSRSEIYGAIEKNEHDQLQTYLNEKTIGVRGDALFTPLHYAVWLHGRIVDDRICDRLEVINLLLNEGAQLEARDDKGKTPLFYARSKDVAEALIAKGARVNSRSLDNSAPLHFTPFEAACVLLEHGADPKATNQKGCQPIHYSDTAEKVELLVSQHGVGVNVRDHEGSSALHYIASLNPSTVEDSPRNAKAAGRLIELGAEVDAQNDKEQTPLFMARFQPQVAEELIESGANPRATDILGNVPLDQNDKPYERSQTNVLVYLGERPYFWKQEKVQSVLTQLGVAKKGEHSVREDLSVVNDSLLERLYDSHLMQSLHFLQMTDLEIAKDLLHQLRPQIANEQIPLYDQAVSSFNALYPEHAVVFDHWNTLHEAFQDVIKIFADPDSKNQRDPKIKELLQTVRQTMTKDNIHMRDEEGNTPLHHAVKLGKLGLPIVEYLLNLGANVNGRNKMGRTPVHEIHHVSVLKQIHEQGGDLLAKDIDGRFPLYHTVSACCARYQLEEAKKRGIKLVHFTDQSGQTALHFCEILKKLEVLIEFGADPSRVDFFGDTALHLNQDPECCESLIKKSAPLNSKNRSGETPLHSVTHMYQDKDKDEKEKLQIKKANMLIKNGAKEDVVDNRGQRPAILAILANLKAPAE